MVELTHLPRPQPHRPIEFSATGEVKSSEDALLVGVELDIDPAVLPPISNPNSHPARCTMGIVDIAHPIEAVEQRIIR